MKVHTSLANKNLITINEIYAIGPAISIMMEGYIEKNKLSKRRNGGLLRKIFLHNARKKMFS